MRVYGNSHVGCVREENQDAFSICTVQDGTLAVVCDGMGGVAGGRVASWAACDAFCQRFSSDYLDIVGVNSVDTMDMHRLCSDAVYAANQAVFERAVTTPGLKGMGTTLSAAYINGGRVYAANVGDSRVYLYRDGTLVRISHDDSLVQQMIDAGRMTEEEARNSKQRHLLTRALGVAPYVECGFYSADVAAGDIVLLCSDGLTAHYRDEELADCIGLQGGDDEDVTRIVNALVTGACARGGSDNVTVACIRIG